jgi:DNA-binding NarL/FixJ family response regulator
MVVCGEADSLEGALAVIGAERPDLAIVDLKLGTGADVDGFDLIKALTASPASVPVLVFSMRDELLYAERALRAGARGYVMKQEPNHELLAAVRRVASGRTHVSERMSERILAGLGGGRAAAGGASPIDRLSDRELEVFELVGRGLATREIARRLRVSVRTIDSHLAHIKEKLALKNGRELVQRAITWTQSL